MQKEKAGSHPVGEHIKNTCSPTVWKPVLREKPTKWPNSTCGECHVRRAGADWWAGL